MRFEATLKSAIYQPWKSNYIDYTKLKSLLKEDDVDSSTKEGHVTRNWSDADEGAFVEELVNVQLEKVNSFQVTTYQSLRDRTSKCEARLEKLALPKEQSGGDDERDGENEGKGEGEGEDEDGNGDRETSRGSGSDHKEEDLHKVLDQLDDISKEVNELEKFSRINYTGFLKAAKKHDRKRGTNYRVRPLLQVRLAALPFNSEDYSPLLYRLSTMYSFVRQNLKGEPDRRQSFSKPKAGGETYKSYKFWVHSENLLEVKTYILRRLPVLVYNPQSSKVVDANQTDPAITSLYFDSPHFSLYNHKVSKIPPASSLRLRWFGQLKDKPEIVLEKKTLKEDDTSDEIRFPIKEKYINSFINGEYRMEKSVQKLKNRNGDDSEEAQQLQKSVDIIQDFIKEYQLQPILRANYTRTAFQIPGDDRLRISIDTNLALFREDILDTDRPCRDPDQWHRSDIDNSDMHFPFSSIRKGEIVRFPHALLEIKIRDDSKKRTNEWLEDLTNSHLVKEAPRFSKFVHGVAQLFDDYINSFPFWLSLLDTDIRQDPQEAFQEEQDKKAQKADDEFAVGSFIGSKSVPSFTAAIGSPVGKIESRLSSLNQQGGFKPPLSQPKAVSGIDDVVEKEDSDDDGQQVHRPEPEISGGLRTLFPSFSTSKYARAHSTNVIKLPPGVHEPGRLIKDSGPVRVEPKVWLANQRTFVKWCHISILLASLSLGLYNAAGESNNVARSLAVVYTLIAIFAGIWGWAMYIIRSRMIEQRSGKDFDNMVGPVVVCIGLVVALCLNFGFKYHAAMQKSADDNGSVNQTGRYTFTRSDLQKVLG